MSFPRRGPWHLLVGRTLLLCFLGSVGLVACGLDDRPLEDRLQERLDARVRRCDVNGASAAVILPDGSLWQGTSGISHESVRMRPEMAFAVGSITKNMVAALILQLAEEGQLSLGDPIGKWLPTYPHVNGAITIRQLLNHTSGLFMFWDNQKLWDDLIQDRTRVFAPEEILSYLKEPYFAPGEGHRYSNTNYLLAAMIVTRVTGSTLSAEMRRRFWEPLALESARLTIEEPYPEVLAHVWGDNFEKGGTVRDITSLPRASHDSITYGSAGVFMTARDLASWIHALYDGAVINQRSLAEMRSFDEGGGSYGLGLGRYGRRFAGGARSEGHGGGNIGTTAYVVHLPDHDVSIAVMVNRFGGKCASWIVGDLGKVAVRHVKPVSVLAVLWSLEGLLSVLWVVAGVGAIVFAIRKDRPLVLIVVGCFMVVAGWLSSTRGLSLYPVLYPEGAILVALGLYRICRRFIRKPQAE